MSQNSNNIQIIKPENKIKTDKIDLKTSKNSLNNDTKDEVLHLFNNQDLLEFIDKLKCENKILRGDADHYINLSSYLAEEVILLRNQVDKFKHSNFKIY